MRAKPIWDVDGLDWPNRSASRFFKVAGLSWHVQVSGQGPALLLIHGTGAATHSWRGLTRLLSDRFTVVAPDLPGHGFSERDPLRALSLPQMTVDLSRLLRALDLSPAAVVGHSAGAAIGLRLILDGLVAPRAMVSLNGALAPFSGLEGILFPALAKLLFLNPVAISMIAWRASDPAAVARVIAQTGSKLDAEGIDFYVRVLRTIRHVGAALGMMANWDLRPLLRDLPRLPIPLTLVAGALDRAVPPQLAADIKAMVPASTVVALPGLGHLAHEEAPATLADIILNACN